MKKIFVLLLILCMLVLCSCSGETDNGEKSTSPSTSTTTAQSTTVPPQRIEHIAQKLEKGMIESFDGYSDEEKEQIKKAVEEDGYSLEFKDDGSGILSNEEGEWTVAKGWVENEYTMGVPEVDFGMVTMSFDDEDSQGKYYMFLIRQASFPEVENYIQKLEQAGFDNITDKVINEDGSMIVFNASNDDGKLVSVGYSANGFTLKLTK